MLSGNSQSPKQRRPKAIISSLAINFLHLRNPFVIAWWSAAFPGFGHLSLGSYVVGFLLFTWEIIVNTQASVNTAILYSFTGRFDMAKEIVNNRWLLLYTPVWVYGIWSSYNLAVRLNVLSTLADRNHSPIDMVNMSFFEINFLDKRIPWISVIWTVLSPGLGHLYTHRIPTGFFILIWWISICYLSHIMQAVQYTALGEFEQAKMILDIEWFIYLPSIFGFAVYDAYANTVEYNRLFEYEQASYLTREYQASDFEMPV
jgi:hypothetical protein